VLYVGGTPRSGSTLVDRVLSRESGRVSTGEIVHLWRRGVAADELCGCGAAFLECPFWSEVGQRAFGGWDRLDPDEVLRLQSKVDRNRYIPLMMFSGLFPAYRRRASRYADLLSRLYLAIADVAGCDTVVDSSKHASTAFFLRRVPGIDLRVVHLVRDSRGVAYSTAKRVRRPEVHASDAFMPTASAAGTAAQWAVFHLLFEGLRAVGTPVTRIRYERFVSAPRASLAGIRRLTGEGIAVDDVITGERSVELPVDHTVSGNPMRFSRGPLTMRVDSEWRERMPGRDRRRAAAVSWPLLLAYGYLRRTRP
jgi:Sulfotransferase family